VRCAILLVAAVCSAPALASEPATIDDALRSLYNFDFTAAHAILNSYISAHPQDPRPHPDPAVRKQFLQAMDDAQKRAEAVLKSNPNDHDGLFAMCVIAGVSTDYMALVEKRQIASLAPARRANGYAQRLLKLDPKFYDAYLTAGFSEYMVGSLPFFIRWFVHFDSVSGDKQRGVRHLELVAREGRYLGPLAKVFLGIIDLREKKPQEARQLLAELVRDYPRNPLYRKELDKLDRELAAPAD